MATLPEAPVPAPKVRVRWLRAVLITFVFLLVAIPNLLREKIPATGGWSPMAAVRMINTLEATYASTYNVGYSSSLAQLGPPSTGQPSADAAGLIDDSALASGRKNGYTFTYTPGPRTSEGHILSYTIRADPFDPELSRLHYNHYYSDQTRVIRQASDRPATAEDPPVGG